MKRYTASMAKAASYKLSTLGESPIVDSCMAEIYKMIQKAAESGQHHIELINSKYSYFPLPPSLHFLQDVFNNKKVYNAVLGILNEDAYFITLSSRGILISWVNEHRKLAQFKDY